jgi:Family of unknown function (DUF6527)
MKVWVTGPVGLQEWLTGIRDDAHEAGVDEYTARCSWMIEHGATAFSWENLIEGGLTGFTWMCPECGGLVLGQLAHSPHTGWDSPRWQNAGTWRRPTLTPSLDCPHCHSHYRLSDGELVLA